MDFVTVSTGLILPYWMGLPIRYIQDIDFSGLRSSAPVIITKHGTHQSNKFTIIFEVKITLILTVLLYNPTALFNIWRIKIPTQDNTLI